MNCPSDRLYHRGHLWVQQDDSKEMIIGVTDYAQEQLGQVVYVDYPEPGTEIQQGAAFGTIESAKTASDLIAPISGVITAVNDKLRQEPWLVNEDPYGQGWILRLASSNNAEFSELMDSKAYLDFLLGTS